MSILFTAYNEETAKRIYAEELVEDRVEDIALEMIQDGEPNEKIVKYTKLPIRMIEQLRQRLSFVLQ